MQWSALKFDSGNDYARVAQHWIKGWHVSTVWLGVDHSFGGDIPVIFETMIFAPTDAEFGGDNPLLRHYAGYMERYSTEDAALAGHDRLLAELRDALSASESDVTVMTDLSAWLAAGSIPDDISAIVMHDERDDDE